MRQASKQRIYVVESDLHLSDLLAFAFRRKGFEVKTFATAETLLAAMDKSTPETCPSLIIQEYVLPDLTGPELISAIRAHPLWKDVKILILSWRTGSVHTERALQAGACEYITKPFNMTHVWESAARHVGATLSSIAIAAAAICAALSLHSEAFAQSYRVEGRYNLELHENNEKGHEGLALVRAAETKTDYWELQGTALKRFDQKDASFDIRKGISLTSKTVLTAGVSAATSYSLYPKATGSLEVEHAFEGGTGVSILGRYLRYKTGNVLSSRARLEQYWMQFRTAYSLFISHSKLYGLETGHAFTQSWYPNDLDKLEASIAGGSTVGKRFFEYALIGEFAVTNSTKAIAIYTLREIENRSTHIFSVGTRYDF